MKPLERNFRSNIESHNNVKEKIHNNQEKINPKENSEKIIVRYIKYNMKAKHYQGRCEQVDQFLSQP